MKKWILHVGTSAALWMSVSIRAYAQQVCPGQIYMPEFEGQVPPSSGLATIGGVVGVGITLIKWLYTIIFLAAILFILLAAYTFITSRGDPEKIQQARRQLMYAIIGIVVALLSPLIVPFVTNSLNSGFAY